MKWKELYSEIQEHNIINLISKSIGKVESHWYKFGEHFEKLIFYNILVEFKEK